MLKECLLGLDKITWLEFRKLLSKYDWLVHGILCFLPVWSLPRWQMVVAVVAFFIILEYEQKAQVWYSEMTWKEYMRKHSIKDLIADAVGVVIALII